MGGHIFDAIAADILKTTFNSNSLILEIAPGGPWSLKPAEMEDHTEYATSTGIADVDMDSLIQCAGNLELHDVANMAMTCRRFKDAAYSDRVWEIQCSCNLSGFTKHRRDRRVVREVVGMGEACASIIEVCYC
eukprot:Gb_04063 [translate_table: standard]